MSQMSAHKTEDPQPVPELSDHQASVTRTNPALARAGTHIRIATIALGIAVVLVLLAWMMISEGAAKYLTGVWSMAAVVSMTTFSVLIVVKIFSAPQASLPGWLALGYLGRILIVACALIGGRFVGAEVRVIGVALVATILFSTLAEVWLLSRARILNVVPLDTSV